MQLTALYFVVLSPVQRLVFGEEYSSGGSVMVCCLSCFLIIHFLSHFSFPERLPNYKVHV